MGIFDFFKSGSKNNGRKLNKHVVSSVPAINKEKLAETTSTKPVATGVQRATAFKSTVINSDKDDMPSRVQYKFPDSSWLSENDNLTPLDYQNSFDKDIIKEIIESTYQSHGVYLKIADITTGPRVTRYEAILQAGTKITKVTSLEDTVKYNLGGCSLQIVAPIPGKNAIGFDIENVRANTVTLKDIICDDLYKNNHSDLVFGRNAVSNEIVGLNFEQLPNLFVAGMSGTGKTSFVHANVTKMLLEKGPDDIKMLFIDSKLSQYTVFNGIPHLLVPCITDSKKAATALTVCRAEADERLRKISMHGLRNIDSYNSWVSAGEGLNMHDNKIPHIIVVIDDWCDLQASGFGSTMEEAVYAIARLSTIVGIHIWLITSQTELRVLSEQIKSVIPERLTFATASHSNNADLFGAERLSGSGDALLTPRGAKNPIHVQMVYVEPSDCYMISSCCAKQKVWNTDGNKFSFAINTVETNRGVSSDNEIDEMFSEVGRHIIQTGKPSIGNVQRVFKIGFNRAVSIMDSLAHYGVVSGETGTAGRQVLMDINEFEDLLKTLD